MKDMMETIQEGFYLVDTGAFAQGLRTINLACDVAPGSFRSRHPAAFVHLLQGLGAKRPASCQVTEAPAQWQGYEVAVILDGRRRIVECDDCDTSVSTHYHCRTCYNGHYDLCDDCVQAGVHCLDRDHWLFRRFPDPDGVIVESTTDVVPPKWLQNNPPKEERTQRPDVPGRAARKPLLYAGTAGTSSETLPYVCSYLLRMARLVLGVFHPMVLLLEVYQSEADVGILREHILSIMDDRVHHRKGGLYTALQGPSMRFIRGWLMFQQKKYQELEAWTNYSLFGNSLDAGSKAELLRLLASAKTEENQVENAAKWLRASRIVLDEADMETSLQATKVLIDLASLSWQVDSLEQCEEALYYAWSNLQAAEVVSPRDRRFVLTQYRALYLKQRRRDEVAVLEATHPDVFSLLA